MKGLLQLGMVAILLFSVSAALSIWLYQSRHPDTDTSPSSKSEKPDRKVKEPERRPDKEPETKAPAKTEVLPMSVTDSANAIALRDREARLERRAAQIDLILRDLQTEREAVDALIKQVGLELKISNARSGEAEPKTPELEKKKAEIEATEKKNIERIASMYDSMAPESAAPILRQMADSGRLDTVVRILASMKERQAARILGELGDTTLAGQIVDRMRMLKLPGGSPSGPTLPASGTSRNPGS